MNKKFFNLEEVAKQLEISEPTAKKLVDSGELVGHQLGPRTYRFTQKQIDDFLAKNSTK